VSPWSKDAREARIKVVAEQRQLPRKGVLLAGVIADPNGGMQSIA